MSASIALGVQAGVLAGVLAGVQALAASTGLMLLVLVLRAPVRRAIGPRFAYLLWVLPVVRMVMPPLPVGMTAPLPSAGGVAGRMLILAIGTPGDSTRWDQAMPATTGMIALSIWAVGAAAVFGVHAVRHAGFCARLRADGKALGWVSGARVVAADVEGPVAFGVRRRFIAVPRDFTQRYDARERALALVHEGAHHRRGDLIAKWVALVVLAAHWWNPVAWIASAAFHDDQEYAADAAVLAGEGPSARRPYAALLARAAGVGAPLACRLDAHANLKGRLMMLDRQPRSLRRIAASGTLTGLLGGTALAATAVAPVPRAPTGRQAVTIGVKPDGAGSYALIVGGVAVTPGAPLPNGLSLPADFGKAGGCDLAPAATPLAMAIKGRGRVETYTVLCASAGPADVRATLGEGLASLATMRTSVAAQPSTAAFPETERVHALAAIDRSIREVRATLGRAG